MMRGFLPGLFLLYLGDGEGLATNMVLQHVSFCLGTELALERSEGGTTVMGGEQPVGLGLEVLDVLLALPASGMGLMS